MVASRLRELGYKVSVQTFALPKGGSSRNVVARTSGSLHAIVVAHLDGVSEGPAANDNASGVAVMLELARVLRASDGVLLAALGAEERAETGSNRHLGSVRLVKSLSPADRRSVRIALSLDMVGYGPTLNVRGLEPTPNRSARLALAHGGTYLRDSGLSDHAELTRAGIPAAWIQWRWDPCWHTACDTAERVKPWKLGSAARLTLAAIRGVLGT
jgi:Zn-dependent M28 family amino/carboxypeptidase